MLRRYRFLFTASMVALGVGSIHCGDTAAEPPPDGGTKRDAGPEDASRPKTDAARPPADGSTPAVPTNHRPTPVACSTTRGPGMTSDAGAFDASFPGQCDTDSQCTAGTNGRCLKLGDVSGGTCTYDACATDSQCGTGKVCVCGTSAGSDGRTANQCVVSNCEVDSDCGPDGYCSPTESMGCGASGVVGYFCHTAADECTNDGDCAGATTDGGPRPGGGYCAWDGTSSKWTCEYGVCSG
jgi:hypothetical protein